MKFNINVSKEDLMGYGKVAGRIGKAIVIEGTKALVVKTAVKALNTSFDEGFSGVKKLGLDDVIGKPKEDKPKRKLFSRNKDVTEELLEEVVEETVEEKLERAKQILEDK